MAPHPGSLSPRYSRLPVQQRGERGHSNSNVSGSLKQGAFAAGRSGCSFVVLFLAASSPVLAHDPGLSALALRVDKSELIATLTLARADAEALVPLEANRDGRVRQEEFEKSRPELERVATVGIAVELNGRDVKPAKVSAQLDPSDAVQVELSFSMPPGARLAVRSVLLASLPRGHRQYASLRDSQGRVFREKMLDANNAVFEVPLAQATSTAESPRSFGQFLLLGVEHIATGYDHLAFLLGLLIVGGRFRAVVKIITSFTLAHSLTLALATLEMIRLPSSVVEPLIAASIVYVGIENVFRRDLDWRWLLAFAFGLIHGCGFASALREVGIGTNWAAVAVPLFSFNLGVELGQLTLAAMVLPIVWRLQQRASFAPRYVPAFSALIALAGACWLAQRLLPLLAH